LCVVVAVYIYIYNYIYTYAVGFRSSGCSLRMVCDKPKDVAAYIVLI
jgi:hypothetical protein